VAAKRRGALADFLKMRSAMPRIPKRLSERNLLDPGALRPKRRPVTAGGRASLRIAAALLGTAQSLSLLAAARPEAEQAKIDRLLGEIRSSGATFLRNDRSYDGKEAAAHLKRKLFFAGSRVRTARDFVLGVATRSEESGRPYEIRFGRGAPRPLRDWLLERLSAIEGAPSAPSPSPTRQRPGAAAAAIVSSRRATDADRIQYRRPAAKNPTNQA
jgi:hypothetical protein